MNDKPLITSLLSDKQAKLNYPLMRALVGSLVPGPREHAIITDGPTCHDITCTKCGRSWGKEDDFEDDCPVPDPDDRPLEVIVEEGIKKCRECHVEGELYEATRRMGGTGYARWSWFAILASPAEKLACILVALDLVVEE